MKKILCFACAMALLLAAVSALGEEEAAPAALSADVMPLPADPDTDLGNGTYRFRVEDAAHLDEGWLTLGLYLVDRYDPEQIKSLKPGNTVLVSGQVYTVAEEVEPVDIGIPEKEYMIWEIVTEEPCWGGLWFSRYTDDSFAAHLDDWIPCTYAGSVRVELPLADGFKYEVYSGTDGFLPYGAEDFLREVPEDFYLYNQYNSDATFRDGVLAEISVSAYPGGPETDGEPPVDD